MYNYKKFAKGESNFVHYAHFMFRLEFKDFDILVSYITNRQKKLLHSSGDIVCNNTNAPLELISKLNYRKLYQDIAIKIIENNSADSIDLEKYVKG